MKIDLRNENGGELSDLRRLAMLLTLPDDWFFGVLDAICSITKISCLKIHYNQLLENSLQLLENSLQAPSIGDGRWRSAGGSKFISNILQHFAQCFI